MLWLFFEMCTARPHLLKLGFQFASTGVDRQVDLHREQGDRPQTVRAQLDEILVRANGRLNVVELS